LFGEFFPISESHSRNQDKIIRKMFQEEYDVVFVGAGHAGSEAAAAA
jgi:hypothetical protein